MNQPAVSTTPRLPRTGVCAFIRYGLHHGTEGSWRFYAWMTVLSVIAILGASAWAQQVVHGLATTGMGDHVSWGLYIANFTFIVGVAAAAVMMVIPAYLYHDRDLHDTVIIGEILAIAAIVMCLMFVTADLGRPDRFLHMMPVVGRFNWPISMLSWDVVVLNGYLGLNASVVGYILWCRFHAKPVNPRIVVPFAFISIFWAVSIHTVTAFLYAGLGGRSFWHTALLAPRFLVTAFVAGPAFIIVALMFLQRVGDHPFGERSIAFLVKVVRIMALANLFMLASEIFTLMYGGGKKGVIMQYLLFGYQGYTGLVLWIWSAIVLNVAAAAMFCWPGLIRHRRLLVLACVMTFVGIWIEKGMGLIIPGFVPSVLHEMVEYVPSLNEWMVMAGIWAVGLMIFTVVLKVAVPLLGGWTPGMAIGLGDVDHQHREIFRRLNNLVRTLRSHAGSPPKAVVQETVDFLQGYVEQHFREEEQLMQMSGYPQLARHQQLHAAFCRMVEEATQRLERGEAAETLAQFLHHNLRNWLVQHIAVEDRAYAAWIHAHNNQPTQTSVSPQDHGQGAS